MVIPAPPTLTHHQTVRAAQNQSIALGPKAITAPGQHKLPGQCGPATQTSSHAPELFTRRSTNAVLSAAEQRSRLWVGREGLEARPGRQEGRSCRGLTAVRRRQSGSIQSVSVRNPDDTQRHLFPMVRQQRRAQQRPWVPHSTSGSLAER